ncbi:ribosome biogenesis GTPase [Fervidobacterium changbaicum]|uniref:Small ribosomal subunit biogenesis GTPase RsgA n=1 Tax=Fervidobacterium changbaicum TaxID=310769 RepID=A0ABX5QT03_9BACT|nr:ribosome small subunit-dependent GTPase A [Fervidobacterium changbaicum]QAV33533.1 ribosome small subunit-dependent GTPase A [Fervidobacterium changbaicum]SDH63212.1 ribosome biogenesis GTPase [Fervidobacterium changbaicum]
MKQERKLGRVIKFYSNLLVVQDLESGERFLCKLRGKFKKQGIRPIVGDVVEYVKVVGNEGVVENILNRNNELKKPSVANVDQVIIVTTLEKPQVPYDILDRFIVLVEYEKLPIVIALNKVDLLSEKQIKQFESIYGKLYPIVKTSAVEKVGLEELKRHLMGKVSVFAGMSGVGKSSLLNAIESTLKLRTGEISEKLERGKHTTTAAELLSLSFGGWVVDTPGFASLEISHIKPLELRELFIEFENDNCFFPDCLHLNEPECFVKKSVEKGKISPSRYDSYVKFLNELIENQEMRAKE